MTFYNKCQLHTFKFWSGDEDPNLVSLILDVSNLFLYFFNKVYIIQAVQKYLMAVKYYDI